MPATAQPGTERLRAHLHQHNQRVLILTVLTLAAAAVLWGVLYFLAWWAFVFFGTVVQTTEFQPSPWTLAPGFAATAVLLCLWAWLARRLRPNQRVKDEKRLHGHLLDILLAVPRVTLSIFGTGGATARLTEPELDYAWRLLALMEESPKSLPMHILPVEIPDPRMRDKILLALQLSGLIEIRSATTGPVIAFCNEEARRLAQHRVRLRV